MIKRTIDIQDIPHKRVVLDWQASGRQETRSGYGKRLTTTLMVQLPESPRWRRVYMCRYGNVGTAYVEESDGSWTVIRQRVGGDF